MDKIPVWFIETLVLAPLMRPVSSLPKAMPSTSLLRRSGNPNSGIVALLIMVCTFLQTFFRHLTQSLRQAGC